MDCASSVLLDCGAKVALFAKTSNLAGVMACLAMGIGVEMDTSFESSSLKDSSSSSTPPKIDPLVSRDWMLGTAEMREKSEPVDTAETSELLENRRRDCPTKSSVGLVVTGAVEPSVSCQY